MCAFQTRLQNWKGRIYKRSIKKIIQGCGRVEGVQQEGAFTDE